VFNTLSIVCLNVRGIVSSQQKRRQLSNWIIESDYDIILLQEWCVHHEHTFIQFPISDFPGYTCPTNHQCLSVIPIWKHTLTTIQPITHTIHNEGQWISWISIFNNNNSVLNIASFYWSPKDEYNNMGLSTISNDITNINKFFKNYNNIY
jgi:exonuclease III